MSWRQVKQNLNRIKPFKQTKQLSKQVQTRGANWLLKLRKTCMLILSETKVHHGNFAPKKAPHFGAYDYSLYSFSLFSLHNFSHWVYVFSSNHLIEFVSHPWLFCHRQFVWAVFWLKGQECILCNSFSWKIFCYQPNPFCRFPILIV